MPEPLVIIGAGGFGRETVDVVEAISRARPESSWRLLGIVDDHPSEPNLARLGTRGIKYRGTTSDLIANIERPAYVVGIGSPSVRKRIADRLDSAGFQAATLIHPDATIGSECSIGEGTIVLAGARVTTNIRVGRHVHLNPNVTVGHDTVLRDFVSLNPSASISGDCLIEGEVLVGVGAVVLNGRRVSQRAVIGAAACVTRNVPPDSTVMGVPAS